MGIRLGEGLGPMDQAKVITLIDRHTGEQVHVVVETSVKTVYADDTVTSADGPERPAAYPADQLDGWPAGMFINAPRDG